MCRILCIGHAAFDITYLSDDFIKENQKYETDNFIECGGGPAANAACLLSAWKIKTAFACAVGKDYYGRKIIEELQNAGTDITLIKQNKGKTNLSFIIINKKNGNRTIINRKDRKLTFNISLELLKKIKPEVILTDGHEPEASLKALKLFPDAVSILDAGSLRDGTRILSDKVNYLVASEKFAMSISSINNLNNKKNRKECMEYLYRFNKNPIITLGRKGLIYFEDNKAIQMKAFPVKEIDTTGAGDIFHGAFAYGILKGLPLKDILLISSAAASLSVEKAGGRTSIPLLNPVLKRAGIKSQLLS